MPTREHVPRRTPREARVEGSIRRLFSSGALAVSLAFVSGASPLLAQRAPAADSGAARGGLPLTPTKPLRFTTDEGTWMALDHSRDGQTIAFDLLGDIYTLPVAGGKATRVTSGQSFDLHPHWSPDGATIAFVSDRTGSDNVWLVNRDGTNARQLTHETDRLYESPTFTPDGKYVVVSKGQSPSSSQLDLYMYPVAGGTGFRLTGDSTAGRGGALAGGRGGAAPLNNFVGPAVSPDGRYVFVSARNGNGGYNQTQFLWQIAVLDRENGRTFVKTNSVGGAVRPELSPDGHWLAFATRNGRETSLMLRDEATGDERMVVAKIQRDDQESNHTGDLLPPYAFTPDSKAIVIAHHGHIWRVSVPDGHETMIPFTADVDQMIAGGIKEQYPLNDSVLTVHQIRDGQPSPDNRRLAFVALDRVWTMDLPHGTPHRLVPSDSAGEGKGEFNPTWSPDGKYIAYVTWTEIDGGQVWRARADGGAPPERMTTQPAYYTQPAYAPDGSRIVVARGPRTMRRDRIEGNGPPSNIEAAVGVELVWLPASGGRATVIAPITGFGRPHFVTSDSTRVYLSEGAELLSMRWDGTDQKTLMRVAAGARGNGALTISPDGQRVLVQAGVVPYMIQEVPRTGGVPTINITNLAQAAVPVRKLTPVGGEFATWSRDSKTVYYSLGHSLFTYDVAAADAAERDSVARQEAGDSSGRAGAGRGGARGPTRSIYQPARYDVVMTVPSDRPRGTVVLRGARIISMKGNEIIPQGDVVVTNNRIVGVGAQGKVPVPRGARIIDVSGKTIIPGYVDLHSHMVTAAGIHRYQPSEYMANLAYGVTTTRDPQTVTPDVLSYMDLVETGEFLGPRIFATGPGIFSTENIRTQEDARNVLTRYSEFYNSMTIKQYMTGGRRVRQLIAIAAREQHLMPTLEGGADFKKNLTEAMDGYSGSEHTLPIAPLFKDVVTLYANSGTTWTPTFIVQYGGPWAENYWYESTNVLGDPKLNRYVSPEGVARRAERRPGWWTESAYSFPLFAAQAAKVVAAGGRVGMGSHGQLQGLGAQWEIWNIASGGMPKLDVLRVATIFGAEAIGLEREVGSLEAGKLADLQVLDKNPLDDIKNTNTIKYVMKNGRLYDGTTLDEIWPRKRAAPRLWWWTDDPACCRTVPAMRTPKER